MKTGPKLNLIKKIWGKRGWGEGFDKEAKSDKKKLGKVWGGGRGGGAGTETKTTDCVK